MTYSRAYQAVQVKRKRLYSEFLSTGDLCYDIGANVGDISQNLLDMGMKVIAVEPVEYCCKYMKKRFKKYGRQITILRNAIGSKIGKKVKINVCNATALSSLSKQYLNMMKQKHITEYLDWSKQEEVETETLDSLMYIYLDYGTPKYIKIDVEGYEYEVLKNLDDYFKIPVISFEFTTGLLPTAIKCINKLKSLGDYKFNLVLREQMYFIFDKWISAEDMIKFIKSLNPDLYFGDIFARLK